MELIEKPRQQTNKDILIGLQMDLLTNELALMAIESPEMILMIPESINVLLQAVSSVLEVVSSLGVKSSLLIDDDENLVPISIEPIFETLERTLDVVRQTLTSVWEDPRWLHPSREDCFENETLYERMTAYCEKTVALMEMYDPQVDRLRQRLRKLKMSLNGSEQA